MLVRQNLSGLFCLFRIVPGQYIAGLLQIVQELPNTFSGIGTDVEWQDASGMELLLQGMERAGFTPGECDKVTHENVLRLYKECL